ncbi:MAG: hypothetical protein NC115_10305 [Bacteroidales bacterium]|nr:hypothetical protein [Bacteroidales bacterium]
MKKYLTIAAALLAFVGCTDTKVETPAKQDKISVAPESLTYSKDGGVQQVIVTSTGEWELVASETYDWVSSDITKGVDGDIVTFKADANYTGSELSAVYTFKTGLAETDLLIVSKSGVPTFMELASASELELTYDVEQVELVFNTNLNYRSLKASVSDNAADWMSFRVAREEDGNVAKLYFTLKKNEGRENREGVITVSADEQEPVEVHVIQRAQPVIVPENNQYVLGLEGGNVEIKVDANIEYSVSVKATEGAEWLKYNGKKNGVETFSASSIAEGKRYSTVTFTEKNPIEGVEPLVVTVSVRQTPPALITSAVDFTKARAYPVWSQDALTTLSSIRNCSFEALVRADDFKTSGSLSTIMGREGEYLLRIGDSGIPSNRFQLATFGKNFTDPSLNLETDTWYHIAVTFDNGKNTVYINGVEMCTGQNANPYINLGIQHNDESGYYVQRCFWVGYAYDSARDFRGLMCELRVWNKTLTAEEINSPDHFYGVDPNSEGLLAYWKLNEGQGHEFEDCTGHGNTLYGETNVRSSGSSQVGDPGANWVEVSLPE